MNLLLVFSRPVPGREAEYHDWYDHRHLADVMAVPGVSSARRYAAADPSADGYLAVYELDGDPAAVIEELGRRYGTEAMPGTDAMDLAGVSMRAWTPLP